MNITITGSRRACPSLFASWIDNHPLVAWLVPVRVLIVPEDRPKRKLLEAAEILVSEKGFDLVSVRDVTGAVKANVAAVNYHFGSREGLMDLLMMRLLEPLCEERLNALDQAGQQRAGKMVSLEEIIPAFTKALHATAARVGMEEAYFLKLAGRILVLPDKSLAPPLVALRANVRERFLASLAIALPETAPVDLAASWRIFDSGLSQAIITLTPEDNTEALISLWTAFGTRGLGGGKPAKEVKKDDGQGMLFDF